MYKIYLNWNQFRAILVSAEKWMYPIHKWCSKVPSSDCPYVTYVLIFVWWVLNYSYAVFFNLMSSCTNISEYHNANDDRLQCRSVCVFNIFANILKITHEPHAYYFIFLCLPFFVLRNPLYVDINIIAMGAFNGRHRSVRSSVHCNCISI